MRQKSIRHPKGAPKQARGVRRRGAEGELWLVRFMVSKGGLEGQEGCRHAATPPLDPIRPRGGTPPKLIPAADSSPRRSGVLPSLPERSQPFKVFLFAPPPFLQPFFPTLRALFLEASRKPAPAGRGKAGVLFAPTQQKASEPFWPLSVKGCLVALFSREHTPESPLCPLPPATSRFPQSPSLRFARLVACGRPVGPPPGQAQSHHKRHSTISSSWPVLCQKLSQRIDTPGSQVPVYQSPAENPRPFDLASGSRQASHSPPLSATPTSCNPHRQSTRSACAPAWPLSPPLSS